MNSFNFSFMQFKYKNQFRFEHQPYLELRFGHVLFITEKRWKKNFRFLITLFFETKIKCGIWWNHLKRKSLLLFFCVNKQSTFWCKCVQELKTKCICKTFQEKPVFCRFRFCLWLVILFYTLFSSLHLSIERQRKSLLISTKHWPWMNLHKISLH